MAGEWVELPFPEVIDFQEGPGIMAKDFRDQGVPLVRLSGLERGASSVLAGCNFLDPDAVARRWCHFALAKGDVLLSTSASLGRIAIVGEDAEGAIAYTGIIRMRPRDDRLFAPFIRYLLEGPDFQQQAEMVGTGSVIRHFGPMHLRQMTIRLPPPDEQRAIAHILGTLDDKIELNRRMSETLEAMARALFKAWFVDFEPVRAKMEGRWRRGQSLPGLPAHLYDLFPDRLVESELGEIPEGWEVVALGELVETVKGRSYKSEELVESDTALVTLKSFARGGGYRPDGLKPFAGTYKAEQVVHPGEVVVACTDVTQAAEVIGRPAIVRRSTRYRRLVASLDTLIVRPKDSRITQAFLYFLGGTEAFVSHTYAHTTGTTVLHLGRDAVPSFTFARPPVQLVQKFDALAAPVLERIEATEQESETLAQMRDTLLPKLISGELRVKDAERFLKERCL
jgi:type I restriction enzyme S subunit